ncbi:DNA helicase HerA-like ATPase [Pseudomonas sp. BIGb0450]|uniref:ATP-binding protein n=1 Tax=unclassified Pseudomonas TaxID=196821 RepID=UPI0021686274|nr:MULTISPECIES: ATP-binding protein [unclassified Pseudomonas]MCS3418090.1 DNA helicase HerA-like ATPase [Pseudomonas sp. BIGb0558]MCS3437662.1 DNA helicase HerA-like ATPase [Pseudomonas sp. BIGb0450]
MSSNDPTYLGVVSAVSGATLTVKLAESLDSGFAVIRGHTYRVGQVGSFVRIPQGYQDLFGIVSEVGATAAPVQSDISGIDSGRWMTVQLAGETVGGQFERGLSQHPNINDSVHLVIESDLRRIYGSVGEDQVVIGHLASAENIEVRLSLDALVTRHSAILGSTGSGKSTTVASLLRSIIRKDEKTGSPGARILMLDIHGEYTKALEDVATVFSATPSQGQESLFVPYWALEAGELLDFITGGLSDAHEIAFTDKIAELKDEGISAYPRAGVDSRTLTVDSPVPFSLKQLWYELVNFETTTYLGTNRDEPALEEVGDADMLIAPKYQPHAMGTKGPFTNSAAKGIRRPLNLLRSRLLDRRYDFLLHPGDWEPDLTGRVKNDLDKLLEGWLGHDKQITILDLSGVPSAVLTRLIGSILRIVYEALFWSREKSEGGVERPLLVVMEEAHRYLGPDAGTVASEVVKRIAKEGRKYGVGAMVVSQRPAEVDETVLSQCGTIIALRLSNPVDRARVKGTLPDNLAGLMDLLPVLRTGEAIITGEAARLPVRCRIALPRQEHLPRSNDPKVTQAWSRRRSAEGYDRVVASWRSQQTNAVIQKLEITRSPIEDDPEEG